MSDYGIQVLPEVSRHKISDEIDGRRLRLTVTDARGISDAVFVYLTRPIDPGNPSVLVADFHKVASSVDLEELPENQPYENANPPWFRLNFVDLLFPSNRQLDECLDAIQEDLSTLITSLTVEDRLESQPEIVFGDLGGSSSSNGSSVGG